MTGRTIRDVGEAGDHDQHLTARIEAEQIRTAFGSDNRVLMGLGALGAWLLGAFAHGSRHGTLAAIPDGSVIAWVTSLSVSHLLFVLHMKTFASRSLGDAEVAELRKPILRMSGYSGFLWGLVTWALLPADPATTSLVAAGLAVVMVVQSGAYGPYRRQIVGFVGCATLVAVAGLLRQPSGLSAVLALGLVIVAVASLMFTRAQEASIRNEIQLRMQIAELHQQSLSARMDAERAQERAELANQAKTTFLAAAGHDLRQPLHALVQYFALLETQNRDSSLNATMDRCGKALDAMQDLLDSILDVSKLMSGVIKPSMASVAVSPLLERVEAQVAPSARIKGLKFAVQTQDLWIHTDEVLLERVLRNLAVNAVRYTDVGGILLRVKRVGTSVRVQVVDSGTGIGREHRERIFEAFYQVGNSNRYRKKGLGLGLAIVKQLTEILGARVTLRTKVGKGSVFTIEVPEADEGVVNQPAESSSIDFAKGAFAVVIDDDEQSLGATSASLQAFGCRTLPARSALEAIESLQQLEMLPQIIVSDYRLEHGTGLDAVRLITENQRALYGEEFRIAALIVTGDTAPSELDKIQKSGLPLLSKPVRPEVLHRAVNEALQPLASSISA